MSFKPILPVLLTGDSPEQKREEIREYFHKTFDLFESIFELLRDDTVFYKQSELTRHPMIFYFGHTATFFINKLIVSHIIDTRINPEFESTFAIGVDEMVWDDMSDSHYQWPSVDAVRQYRQQVRQKVDELITTLPLTLPIKSDDPFWIILMGIEHENIHIETSSVLHRQLPLEDVKIHPSFAVVNEYGEATKNSMVEVRGREVRLGKSHDYHLYGWDNEYGLQVEKVSDFSASKQLVSNAEFMAFVSDGGYENENYWDEEGRAFLAKSGVKHPSFWIQEENGSYRYRALTQEIPMPMNWPVDVNYLEAKAFCRWKSQHEQEEYRLLSEAEWYCLYEDAALEDVPNLNFKEANISFAHGASAMPVNYFKQGKFYDVVGNVWQWSESAIDGFEGFEPHQAYDDFSTPTFDGKHNLIKGGSWASCGNEITKHSRYAFRRHFYQHAGFRYVIGEKLMKNEENIYESDMLVSQYCAFQYGEEYFGVENFAKVCAQKAIAYAKGTPMKTALDLGCATGRASFELAREFEKVTGIDFSARFVQVGAELQKNKAVKYLRAEEGDLVTEHTYTLADFDLNNLKGSVDFWQGDACNLKTHFSGYDLLMGTNLIDRLYEPRLFLDTVHERINDNGILILTSPYTWLEEYTAKEFWLGGFKDENGNDVQTIETLKKILGVHFELVALEDVPFVIRETPRKYQHTLSQMSVWKKRA